MMTMTKMNVAMISETAEPVMPPAKSVCMFLSDYSGWLLGCGATCIRLEKNVQRIARTYGKRAEITITPRHVHISMIAADSSETFTTIAPVRRVPVSFNTITRLSRLSWEIADSHLSLEEASERFDDIVSDDRQNKWLVLVLVSLANASVRRGRSGDGYCRNSYYGGILSKAMHDGGQGGSPACNVGLRFCLLRAWGDRLSVFRGDHSPDCNRDQHIVSGTRNTVSEFVQRYA